MDPTIFRELSLLNPAVPFRATTNHLHYTWARTFYSRPELYIRPRSLAEIQQVVILARRCRRRIVTVGSGHSPSDLTCTSSWLVSLDDFNRILSISPESGIVTVEAGIRLKDLGVELEKHGLALPNLGSIDHQSIAGVMATGTHGSSLRHGLLSECVLSLSLMLADGNTVRCSNADNPSLFRAALISLGALGIVTKIEFKAVPAFRVAWRQSTYPLSSVLACWSSGLWTSHEFIRIWWLPYSKSAIVWSADKTDLPLRPPPKTFYGGKVGYHIYHNLLALSNWFPRILPWVEWFIFGMQYGFKHGAVVTNAVEPSRQGLLMDCLYSQFVNEWAMPLEKGPEAITRLSAWINGDSETARIPFDPRGVWVHCPIEVRVADTTLALSSRPYLDPACRNGPTLYLNATLYRPYHRDPPCKDRYYEAFEWLMREMGGRPHWGKNFSRGTAREELHELHETEMDDWLKVRNEVDVDGLFVGEWHRRNLPLPSGASSKERDLMDKDPFLPLEEREVARHRFKERGAGDGLEWIGDRRWTVNSNSYLPPTSSTDRILFDVNKESLLVSTADTTPPGTATSEEGFDILAHGEASVIF
jgi:D-arabinono-1,4-lactone oxidase